MWLMTDRGFVSLVEDRDDRDVLQVRARVKEDILGLFPEVQVLDRPGGDYQFRARLSRSEVANVLAAKVMSLDYGSHAKDVALDRSEPNPARYRAYYTTWSAMAEMQPCAPYSTTPRPPRSRWEDEDDLYDYREENE